VTRRAATAHTANIVLATAGAAVDTAAVQRKPVSIRPKGADYEFRIIGDHARSSRDFYHGLLRLSWATTFVVIAGGFLAANACFALLFMASGGVANARPGSFADAFYFSVQTMGTIGYGAMHPQSTSANLLVVILSIVGLVVTALATGLVFSKFSRPTARGVFTRQAVITLMDKLPTLMFRLGNERGNQIVDVQFRVVLTRTEHTAEDALISSLSARARAGPARSRAP
jgi:inward rectifier potassium channel